MFPADIETERLRLERLARDRVDVFDYYELWATADEVVYEYLSATPFATPKPARDEMVAAEEYWADRETATYVVRPESEVLPSGTLAGRTSLDVDWDRRVGELGVMLDEPFWDLGLAGECADALVKQAFKRLDLGVVTAGHKAGHEQSQGVLEKLVERYGGQYDGVERTAPSPGTVREYHSYSVTRDEYRSATD